MHVHTQADTTYEIVCLSNEHAKHDWKCTFDCACYVTSTFHALDSAVEATWHTLALMYLRVCVWEGGGGGGGGW